MKIDLFNTVKFVVGVIVICCLLIIIRGFNESSDMKEHHVRMWVENGLISLVSVSLFLIILNKLKK